MASSSSSTGGQSYRSRFGDTTLTKVFVGGLAWETPTEKLQRYFEQFGDILEAVIITDKNTGRSKGYGFVTFRDPESARRSVTNPNPVIDGRRANCNIAALGRPRPSPPRVAGRGQVGPTYQGPQQGGGPQYGRGPPAQMLPPPAPVYYPPYGYMPYATDYSGYPQAMYNPQFQHPYYHQLYGPGTSPTISPQGPYHLHPFGYGLQSTRPGLAQRPPYMQYQAGNVEGSSFPVSSLPHGFRLQPPPHARQSQAQNTNDLQNPQESSPSNSDGPKSLE